MYCLVTYAADGTVASRDQVICTRMIVPFGMYILVDRSITSFEKENAALMQIEVNKPNVKVTSGIVSDVKYNVKKLDSNGKEIGVKGFTAVKLPNTPLIR